MAVAIFCRGRDSQVRIAWVFKSRCARRSQGAWEGRRFDQEATKLQDVKFLAQGTIYPDVIEFAAAKTGKAHVIKSRHNVGGLPEDMQFELVEPLGENEIENISRVVYDVSRKPPATIEWEWGATSIHRLGLSPYLKTHNLLPGFQVWARETGPKQCIFLSVPMELGFFKQTTRL